MPVKTVTLCKKFIFFHEMSKRQEKEAGTNVVQRYQSKEMIGQFMKTYLVRRIKVLQFLTPERFRKNWT